MRKLTFRSLFISSLVTFFTLMLVACGGGGGSSSSGTVSGTGSVAIAMTDGATEDFDEINVTVVKIELLADGERVTVFEGNRTFNLLDLADESDLFAIRNDVPAGTYDKIRLTLTEIELINLDEHGNVVETAYPKLPGNGKLDLNPRGEFTVSDGETLVIQIDMDANKSIHIVGTGSGKYKFRPVVFVDVISETELGKLVRVHGVVQDIDDTDQEFKLCETDIPVRLEDNEEDPLSQGCIQVDVVNATSIFDAEGQPADFADLVEGEEATVYGKFRRDDSDDDEDGDDEDDNSFHHELEDLELLAAVVELGAEGTFRRLDGEAQTGVGGDDRFTMSIDPGQGFVTGTDVEVQIQEGTLIINRFGETLDVSDIGLGVPMKVDGVLDISVEPDVLYAALIVIDTDTNRLTKLSGTLGANPDGGCGFNLVTAGGDRSISYNTYTRAYVVSTSGSEAVDVADLPSEVSADVFGVEASDGCFAAETIIAFQ